MHVPREPIDVHGHLVAVGTKVRLLRLVGSWLKDLSAEERRDVMSMIGETFFIEEVDEYGQPWVRKSWPNEAEGRCHSHSIALEPQEFERV
ncbi:MAG: hypothetical protein EKK52_13225 [Burkholderiales bacterium]|nr:MAG: hypothetical protein EKK52_13225 [Burkholderiales bacterium]